MSKTRAHIQTQSVERYIPHTQTSRESQPGPHVPQNGISDNLSREKIILISTTPRVTLNKAFVLTKHDQSIYQPTISTTHNQNQPPISTQNGLSGAQPRWSSHVILYVGSSNSNISPGVPSGFHLYSTAYPLTGRPQPHTAYPRVCTDMPKSTIKRVTSHRTARKTTHQTGTHKVSHRISFLSQTH